MSFLVKPRNVSVEVLLDAGGVVYVVWVDSCGWSVVVVSAVGCIGGGGLGGAYSISLAVGGRLVDCQVVRP